MMELPWRSTSLIVLFCTFISILWQETIAEPYTASLRAEDLIAQVNTNVKPFPLRNPEIIKYLPAEQRFNPLKDVAKQLFEGCITLDENDRKILDGRSAQDDDSEKLKKSLMEDKRWTSQTIPYEVIHIGLGDLMKRELLMKVEHVLHEMMESVCLNFRPKNERDSNWIIFYDGYGCHSDFGKKSSRDPSLVSIGKGCQTDAVITHLLMHALGILHEQNRMDRDQYVDIQWQNVRKDNAIMFEKHRFQTLDNQSHPYDYQSIMHFSKSAFATDDDKPTMLAKTNQAMQLGARKLSFLDVEKINTLFGCPKYQWQEWETWSLCSKPCGYGYRRRKRVCANGAHNCIGRSSELRSCRDKKCFTDAKATTFEESWGIWKPRSQNNCNWRRGRTRGRLQPTGPQEDHTTGLGRFAQVRLGDACQPGVEATMYTNKIRPIYRETCLSFFYYMQGYDVGKLNLLIKDLTSREPSLLWTRQGDQGNDWQQGAVTIPYIPVSYKFFMVATIGPSNQSDISVDDINIDVGRCPEGIEGCSDYYLRCKEWSLMGECYKNAGWMLHSCCKSCIGFSDCLDANADCKKRAESGECADKPKEMWATCCSSCENCLDQDNRCKFWASAGECNANPDWMLKNCKSSCGVCIV